MKTINVTIVRIYITESSHLLNSIVKHLKQEVEIRGVSVFRAISGFGATGEHTSTLIDISLDLPLTIEFFDADQTKIKKALDYLSSVVKPQHVISWNARSNV